ncbi:hypothetical protein CGU03_18165, partial [Vibrio metoecus]
GLSTRGVSSPNEPRWLQLLCLSLVVMRCQPLRRALCTFMDELYEITVQYLCNTWKRLKSCHKLTSGGHQWLPMVGTNGGFWCAFCHKTGVKFGLYIIPR